MKINLSQAFDQMFCAHAGQTRRGGEPYFKHPYRVRKRLARMGEGREVQAAALLHDVLEDSDFTIDDLKKIVPQSVVDAVVALTKIKGESYSDYLDRVAKNEVAVKVKIADMIDNLSDDPTPRQIKKYAQGLYYLTR